MGISNGAQVGVYYIAETVAGTTPATPQTIAIPYVSFDMELTKDVFSDPSRTADNQNRFLQHGAFRTNGNLKVALSHAQFDDFLAAGFMGTWATNVLKVGNTRIYFTIEEFDANQTPNIGRVFTGCEVDTVSISITANELVSADFAIKGRNMSLTSAMLDTTPTAVQNKTPLIHVGGFIKLDTVSIPATALSFTINNAIEQINTLGANNVYGSTNGKKKVQGQVTVLLENTTIYNKFIQGTSGALTFQVSDGTNTLTFNMPQIKSTAANASAKDTGARYITLDFEALYDNTLGSIMSVARS